ncbi:MAG: AEC family transporter [Ignavibacteriae bacterium]|nr:AEC family transporter [Ignavibacteriota bacterium]
MDVQLQMFECVISFAILVSIIYYLKTKNFFVEAEGKSFSKLLVEIVLPAMIFMQLATHRISSGQFILILIMLLSGIITIFISYLIARILTSDRGKIGAFMIASSFGSSALLGYPLIQMVFPNNPEAMIDAVLISEIGVGLPLFIFCPLVAMWFGNERKGDIKFFQILLPYLKSPVFFALILGLIFSVFKIDPGIHVMNTMKSLAQTLGNGIGLLSCVVLGIYLKPKSFKGVILLILFSAVLEMGFQPFITSVQASLFGVSDIHRKILIFISSMPAAILGPVFAVRYDCAPDTASVISYSHIILALISIPLINLVF